jgi:hypothetical protein
MLWKSAHRSRSRFGFKESANDYLNIMPTMEIDVDLFLAGMANDSARWKRLGRFGTLSFVEGLLDGLTGVGAITRDEAAARRDLFLAPSNIAAARFSSTGDVSMIPPALAPGDFPHFVELIPAAQPAKDLPDVCSFQILGIERYDVKGAIIWRMVPILGPESTEEAKNLAALGTGPEVQSIELSDDRGTSYQMMGGTSGGRIERVGRYEFRPAPPDDATILKVHWEELVFEINLGSPIS